MEGGKEMKNVLLVSIQIALGLLLFQNRNKFTKPIHLIAFTFFALLMIYSISSLLPILGEGVIVLKKHMNPEVFRF